jgi:broad specificity phosphatase PhoE
MMGSRLILVRHALPAIDTGMPSRTWSLTPEGHQQAQVLGRQLQAAGYRPALVAASTEPKAQQTASGIVEIYGGMPIEVVADLREHERETAPFLADRERWYTLVADFFRCSNELVFGEETARQALQRFSSAVEQLVARLPEATTWDARDLLIVTHGTVLSLFLARYGHGDAFALWQDWTMPDAIVLELPNYVFLQRFRHNT